MEYHGTKFTTHDIVDPDEWIAEGEYNPHNVRPWLLHDHGFTLAIVFASNLQDALDAAVDGNRMDRFMIDVNNPEQRADYMTADPNEMDDGLDKSVPEAVIEGVGYWWKKGHTPAFLGNASEPFDLESVSVIELPNVPRPSYVDALADKERRHEQST